LCKKCLNIPWEDLMNSRILSSFEFTIYAQPPEELKATSCQLCQFVAKSLLTFFEDTKTCQPPYQLRKQEDIAIDDHALAVLHFKDINGYWNQPLRGAPAFLIIQNQSYTESRAPQNLLIGGLPLGLIQRSLATCREAHGDECQPEYNRVRNLKVFDCETCEVVPAPENCRYVALSYVWGPQTNDSDTEGSIKHNSMPKTIEDSLRVTKSLGYRYLWVDFYCIDQSSPSERHDQISQMADIYACAQLTIIAAAGENADHGLPGIVEATKSRQSLSLNTVTLLRYPLPLDNGVLSNSKWASRAWTFQECYFSSRRLFILDNRAVYICNSRAARHMPRGWFPSRDTTWPTEHEKLRAMRIIEAYCGREMTFQSDALRAIYSALNTFDNRTIKHVWGLVFSTQARQAASTEVGLTFSPGLLWAHEKPCTRRSEIPSWSPIAWTGKIFWCDQPFVYSWKTQLVSDAPNPVKVSKMSHGGVVEIEIEDKPQRLQITASMSRLGLIRTSQHPGYEQPAAISLQPIMQYTFLKIPLGASKSIKLISHAPNWDVDPLSLDLDEPVLGIFFDDGKAHGAVRRPAILLVQWQGDCFERIGVLPLSYPSYNVHCHFVHKSKYLRWCAITKEKSQFGHLEVCDSDHYVTHDSPMYQMYRRDEWKSCFKERTIVLG
ncbi:heterokaryon incompatibility protein-domain-containing protein, partial [Phaeosphaeria sp. MPI-PUGE-AT-0046c]